MKKFLLVIGALAALTLYAEIPDNLNDLLSLIEKENQEFNNWEAKQSQDTQLDMNEISLKYQEMNKRHLNMIFNYKLNSLKTMEERSEVIKDFEWLIKKLEEIDNRSWEHTGSLEGMRRSYEKSSLVNYQQKIWLFKPKEAAIWKKIANSSIPLGKAQKLKKLQNGRVDYTDILYNQEVNLSGEINLNSIFSYENRYFFVLNTDLTGGGFNFDFINCFLCEVRDNRVVKIVDLGDLYFGSFKIEGDMLHLYGTSISNDDDDDKILQISFDLNKF